MNLQMADEFCKRAPRAVAYLVRIRSASRKFSFDDPTRRKQIVELENLLDLQLDESFAMYEELVASLAGNDLARKLPVPSNIIGDQLWCVIGARESWARAIEKGAWDGFACSITSRSDVVDLDTMRKAVANSAMAVRAATAAAPRDAQRTDLKLRLLVHESQHQGQLLRYLLGLRLPVPTRWRERYALGPEK